MPWKGLSRPPAELVVEPCGGDLAKGVKHFKEEGRKVMCEAVEKYAEKKVALKVKEERSLMTQIVAALVADKDNDTIIKELNCTLEQIIPLRTVMGK